MLGGLGVGLAVILMVVAWQLSSGPISLAFLTPYIEKAVNAGQPNFKLTLKDTILTWAGWDRTLDIRVLDVRVMRQLIRLRKLDKDDRTQMEEILSVYERALDM